MVSNARSAALGAASRAAGGGSIANPRGVSQARQSVAAGRFSYGGGNRNTGGGSVVSGPNRTNSMPGASVMRDAQYGNGTQLGGRQYANILGGIAGRVADWQGAGRLSQRSDSITGLVGLGLDLANRGRSLNFNPTPSTARRAFVNRPRPVSSLTGRQMRIRS